MRRGLAVVAAVCALVALLVSVTFQDARTYVSTHPVTGALLDDAGQATVDGVTLRLHGVEPAQKVAGPWGDIWVVPEGWTAWFVRLDAVEVLEEQGTGSVESLVLASDGKVYRRPPGLPPGISPAGGWLSYVGEAGQYTDLVLLPEGVDPVTVRVVQPFTASEYWSFPVPAA